MSTQSNGLPLPFSRQVLQIDHTRDLLHIVDQFDHVLAFIDKEGRLNGLPIWTLITETPDGDVPGTVYVLSKAPVLVLCVFVNGVFQMPTIDYTLTGTQITFVKQVLEGDHVYVVYTV